MIIESGRQGEAATGRSLHYSKLARSAKPVAIAALIAGLSFAAGGIMFGARDNATPATRLLDRATSATAFEMPRAVPIASELVAEGTPRLLEQGAPFSFANLVEHVSPAVVTVLVERERAGMRMPDNIPEPFRDFFRRFGEEPNGDAPQPRRATAMGSGFIIDATGYVVTNNHVIEGSTEIMLRLPDGREFEAQVVGVDAATDVALLRVDGVDDLPTVAFGDDRRLRVGDWVVAVGNPFGLGGTVTAGIVSSIGRDIGNGPYTDFIQIDAPINQGNSGGPTFDLSGRVVGMNSAIFSPSGGSVGIGFAIPSSTVQEIVLQLKEGGAVARGWLGVEIQNLTPDMAASLGVPGAKGAIVAAVVDNSPAQEAGFRRGDVVLSVNDEEVNDQRDLTRRVGNLRAGERASFRILREGDERTIAATIAPRDEEQVALVVGNTPQSDGTETSAASLGLGIMPLNQLARGQFDIDDSIEGVLISTVDPDSEAAEKGIRPGNVIIAVGNDEVRTPDDIVQGIASAKEAGRDSVLLLIYNGRQTFVALNIEQE